MERLPKNRASNIERLEAEFKERFIAERGEAKELDKQRTAMRMQRIHSEREKRYDDIMTAKKANSDVAYADVSILMCFGWLLTPEKLTELKAIGDTIVNKKAGSATGPASKKAKHAKKSSVTPSDAQDIVAFAGDQKDGKHLGDPRGGSFEFGQHVG